MYQFSLLKNVLPKSSVRSKLFVEIEDSITDVSSIRSDLFHINHIQVAPMELFTILNFSGSTTNRSPLPGLHCFFMSTWIF